MLLNVRRADSTLLFPMWNIFKSFLQQAQIIQSRSSVINPLQWSLVISIAALLTTGLEPRAPRWLPIFFAVLTALIAVLLIGAYIFFMVRDPDALRSERYSLMKTAMEKHLVGDNLVGLHEVIKTFDGAETKLLESGDTINIEHKL